jgi:signal transduction histidine kinase
LSALLFVAIFPSHLSAQNNPFKIDDELFEVYKRAFDNRTTQLGLQVADTLRTMSVRKGDKKAECLAYVIYMQHYRLARDEKGLLRAIDNLKRVSRRNGYMQYYYYGPQTYITYLLNNGRSMEAMQENIKLEKEAFAEKSNYGILTCMKNTAHIQTARDNIELAYQYNLKALDFQLRYVPDQDPAPLYNELCNYCRITGDYAKAMEYNDLALKSARLHITEGRALLFRCLILYDMHRYDEFRECYARWQKVGTEISKSDAIYVAMMICKYMVDGNTAGALGMADSLSRPDSRYIWKARIYHRVGDYETAYDMMHLGSQMHDSIINALQTSDIAEMNTRIGRELLEQQLESKQREAMTLQLKHVEQQMVLERQKTENEHLKLSNRELEIEKYRDSKKIADLEHAHQLVLLQDEKNKTHYQQRMTVFVTITSLIVLNILLFALLKHRLMLVQIRQKNAELEVARDEADSANRMKTAFIQNMSHEIRTPLNSIVGFSQLLATPGLHITDADAQEYSRLIQNNSEQLTSLVNELLSLADLESSKNTIVKAPAIVNDMCREAMSAVRCAVPDGVELRFVTDASDEMMVNTDALRVKKVLTNYLTNAAKHTAEGYIELRCSLADNPGRLTFSVTDTGCGVPPEKAGEIFNRFEQLNSFDVGMGIGLNLCSVIADRLDGSVSLDITYTGGARFLFVIPIEDVHLPLTA